MEVSTPSNKKSQKNLKKFKETPPIQKPKIKKHKKQHVKANSVTTFRDLDLGFNDIKKSRKFYIDLQETQLMNLYTAIKIKTVLIKKRFEALINNAFVFKNKQRMAPQSVLVLPSPKSLRNISPITTSDSQCANTSFGNTFEFRSQKNFSTDFDKKLENIEKESEKIFEGKLKVESKIKAIRKSKGEAIVAIGNLYQKKRVLGGECGKLMRFVEENKKMKKAVKGLQERFMKVKERTERFYLKYNEKKEVSKNIKELILRVESKKAENAEITRKLNEIESLNSCREQYLKEIIELKEKVVARAAKMKEFDYYLTYTKQISSDSLLARKNSSKDL